MEKKKAGPGAGRSRHVYFIGIGGISMSGLARILMHRGYKVSGSDMQESELTKELRRLGAGIFVGQRAENVPADADLVVYTAAIHPDNPEYMRAVELGIQMVTRAELLGEIMRGFDRALAVAGTHGKTTTTSMTAQILMEAGQDPTVSVGGMFDAIGGNIRIGEGGIFLTEACEYTDSFLKLFPTAAAVLNVEEDHLDFFKDLDDITQSFSEFAALIPKDGVLVINADSPQTEKIVAGAGCRVVYFGEKAADGYRAVDCIYDNEDRAEFTLCLGGKELGRIKLAVSGAHNVQDALAAAALCMSCGVDAAAVKRGLEKFGGTKRRFEKKGEVHGVVIMDDYAHHPGEIRATLSTAVKRPHGKLWCVFQSHTYTRTKALFSEFASALSMADEVVVADIYPARETDTLGMTPEALAKAVEENGTRAEYVGDFGEIADFLLENVLPGDVIITMGAGDVYKVGEILLGER